VDAAFIAFRRRVREVRGTRRPTRSARGKLLTNSGLFHRVTLGVAVTGLSIAAAFLIGTTH
jgi:hypothetical protein